MPESLIARPSKMLMSYTPTWAVSSANSEFPVANVLTLETGEVAKAVGSTATLRLTFGAPVTLEGLMIANLNFPGVTVGLTNNGGMAQQDITIEEPEDEVSINGYWDLRGVAGRTAAQWNIAVVGSDPVAIGSAIPVETWDLLRLKWEFDWDEAHPVNEKRNGLRQRFINRIPVRVRLLSAIAPNAKDLAMLRSLRREAHGPVEPWGLIPDSEDDESLVVQFVHESASRRYVFYRGKLSDGTGEGNVDFEVDVEEVNAGVSLT